MLYHPKQLEREHFCTYYHIHSITKLSKPVARKQHFKYISAGVLLEHSIR